MFYSMFVLKVSVLQHMTNKHTREVEHALSLSSYHCGKEKTMPPRAESFKRAVEKILNAPAFLSISVNMKVKCFPLSECHSSLHAYSFWNGETFSEVVSISNKVTINHYAVCPCSRGAFFHIFCVFSGSEAAGEQGNDMNGEGFSLGSLLPGRPGVSTFEKSQADMYM